MNYEKITLMIDKITWEKFRRYCSVNAFKISSKIELLLEEEIGRGPKTKNLLDMFKEIVENRPEGDTQTKQGESGEPVQDPIHKTVVREDHFQRSIHEGPIIVQNSFVRGDNPKMVGNGKVPTIDQLMIKRRN